MVETSKEGCFHVIRFSQIFTKTYPFEIDLALLRIIVSVGIFSTSNKRY